MGARKRKAAGPVSLGPQSLEDYVGLGGWLIYKPLLAVGLPLLAAALVLLALWWLRPEEPYAIPTFTVGEAKLTAYSGEAVLLEREGRVVYRGQVAAGRRSGPGAEYDPTDGALVYEGAFALDCYEGQGRFFLEGRLHYEGGFSAGVFEGEGVLWEGDLKRYEGGFLAGRYCGQGVLFDRQEQPRYIGEFAEGLYNGTGRLMQQDITLYEGEFRDGAFHGEGRLFDETGRRCFEGRFTEGEPGPWGSLYNGQGQCLYTGEVKGLFPDPPALLGLPAAALGQRLHEPPVIYYGGGWVGCHYPELGLGTVARYDSAEWHPQEEAQTPPPELIVKASDSLTADLLLVEGQSTMALLPGGGAEIRVEELPGFVAFLAGQMARPADRPAAGVTLEARGERLYEVAGLPQTIAFAGEGIVSGRLRYAYARGTDGKGAVPGVVLLSREEVE